MKHKLAQPLLFGGGLITGIFLVVILGFDKNQESAGKRNPAAAYQWEAPELPTEMSFAGESVPLDKWDVRERLDRQILYNYYMQNNVLYMLKLANRYFPEIESRLKANGIPEDFKYLCVAESNLQQAISKSNAVGFWQFLSGTAVGYNMEINSQVDERYHIKKSTDAACRYLKSAYSKFGSWTAAAASYNCGMNGYQSRSDFQQSKNYYDLMLPEETNRYIFRILAFKHLIENAKALGYVTSEEDLYAPIETRTVTVTSTIPDLAKFAISQGSDFKTLILLNPWLRARSLTVKPGKSYIIDLPK